MSSGGINAGTVFLDVEPDMEGFGAKLGAEVRAGMTGALPGIKSQLTGAFKEIGGGFSQLKGIGMGLLGGGALFAGLDILSQKSTDYFHIIEKLKAVFGTTTADASRFNAVVSILGGNADAIAKILVRLDASLVKVGGSTSNAAANLAQYGLNADSLSVKAHGLTGVMVNLAKAYNLAPDKQSFIAQVLGPRGAALAPILKDWAGVLTKVDALGLDWNKILPTKGNVEDFEIMQFRLKALVVEIGTAVMPIIEKFGNALANFFQDVKDGKGAVSSFFKDIIFGVGGVTGVVVKLFALITAAKILSALASIGKGFLGIAQAGMMIRGVGFGQLLAEMELGMSGFLGVETATLGVTTALALEFVVLAGAIFDVLGLLKLYSLARETQKSNAEADLADVRTMLLQVGLDAKSGADPVKALSDGIGGLSLQQLAQLKAHPELFQQELNRMYEDGSLTLKQYTDLTMGTGKSLAQVDVMIRRLTADMAKQAAAATVTTKTWHSMFGQLAVGSKLMGILSDAAGVTAGTLKTNLLAAIDLIKTDGGAAFGDFVRSTEAAMKDWATNLTSSFVSAISDFDNLAKKSHQTMQYILMDAVRFARDTAHLAENLGIIDKRAGTNAPMLEQFLAAHGITTPAEIAAIAKSSPAALRSLIQSARSSNASIAEASLPVLDVANQGLMALIDKSGVLDQLKTVLHLDSSQLDSAGAKLTGILNLLGGVGAGRLIIGFTDAQGNEIPTGPGRSGRYAPSATTSSAPQDYVGIHHMAAGGIVTRPTVVVVGDAGSEAVIPLSKLSRGRRGRMAIIDGAITIDNWADGTGHIRGIAQDVVLDEADYQDSMARMHR